MVETSVERAVATFKVNEAGQCAFLIVVRLQRVSCRLQTPVTLNHCHIQQIASRVDRYDLERQGWQTAPMVVHAWNPSENNFQVQRWNIRRCSRVLLAISESLAQKGMVDAAARACQQGGTGGSVSSCSDAASERWSTSGALSTTASQVNF